MATRMSVELTEAEKALLPYMTNDLYDKNHSVIATLFPVRHIVGQRLVDNGLLTSTEYLEICNSPENVAGSRLICSLNRKGDESMATFYKVLVSAKGERGVDSILRCLETAADQERRSKESGTGALDISTHSPSADLLPGGSPPLASLDLVIKYITEMRAEMREIKETMRKLVESHLRMEQQLLESVNNIEAQPPCIMQSSSISLAQSPRHLELGSNESVYQTCPHSRTSSKGDHDLIATRVRHNSLPPTTLHLLTDSKQQLVDRQTSPTSKDHKLDYVLEESTDISTQHTAEGTQEGENSNISNPAELVSSPIEEPKEFSHEPPPQRRRRRRPATVMVNPFKAIFHRLSRTGGR